LDDVVCHRQNSARAIQGPHFSCPVWGPTGICPWPHTVCLVYGRNRPNRCSARLKFHQYADNCQIYVATSVSAVHSAIDQLSRCLHDVDVSASRLRLNASKTHVLWLGSRHNIDRLTVHEVPVLSSTVTYCRRRRLSSCRSRVLTQHATSALSLTAGCQWPATWRQSLSLSILSFAIDPHCSLCHVTLQRH